MKGTFPIWWQRGLSSDSTTCWTCQPITKSMRRCAHDLATDDPQIFLPLPLLAGSQKTGCRWPTERGSSSGIDFFVAAMRGLGQGRCGRGNRRGDARRGRGTKRPAHIAIRRILLLRAAGDQEEFLGRGSKVDGGG